MKQQTLNGTWKLSSFDSDDIYESTIPGSVLSFMIDNQAIEDPYDRDNEYEVGNLFWKDYVFFRNFCVDEELFSENNIDLVCYGLDTLCEIYINDNLVAETNNMHRTWRLSIKNHLRVGDNEIRILFRSTLQYINDYEYAENKQIQYIPCGCMKGNQLLRKTHSMFGWDWGPKLPDAGIFRDIEIEAYSKARLEEVKIEQIHKENQVILKIDTLIKSFILNQYELEVYLYAPDMKELAMQKVDVSNELIQNEIIINEPELWWPNGFGKQPLYELIVRLRSRNELLDQKCYRIGLRTLTISQEKDEWGSEFAFMVNGFKIFTKGANYIPEDCVYSRITRERMEYLIKSSVRANYNCLRIWGGGYYPSDTFYDLCDEYGLIVWQDLMYACNVYDVTDEFEESIVAETKDNVKRLRHHASLGLWCGNNEIESAWDHWGDFQKETNQLRSDYIKQFEYILPKTVKETDQDTFYWPSSPSSGGCFDNPDDENRGDTHYWSVWHGLLPFSDYQNHYFRFCSEFGFQSFPSLKTVKTFTRPEDRNIFSKVMESHQKNDAANGKMLYYLSENFQYPKDFEQLLYVTQILQGIAIKSGVEHFRRNRGRCMGSLYWQLNDNWPVASWSSIDYYGRWKALHYMAKNFYAPVAASLVRSNNTIKASIQNESLKPVSFNATLSLKSMDFKLLNVIEYKSVVQPLSVISIGEIDYTDLLQGVDHQSVFVELKVEQEDGSIQYEVETFVPYKYLKLPDTDITVGVTEERDSFCITLQSEVFAAFVELDFEDADVIFSDNYFTLTNNENREIRLNKLDIMNGEFTDTKDVLERLKVRSLRDTYSFE